MEMTHYSVQPRDGISKNNLLDNTPNQPTKFRTKNWFEINDDTCGTCNKNSQINLKLQVYVIIVMRTYL